MCVIAYADERRRAARLGPTGPLLTLTGYHGQSQTEAGTPDRDTDLPEIKREEGAGGSGGCAGVGGGGRQWVAVGAERTAAAAAAAVGGRVGGSGWDGGWSAGGGGGERGGGERGAGDPRCVCARVWEDTRLASRGAGGPIGGGALLLIQCTIFFIFFIPEFSR